MRLSKVRPRLALMLKSKFCFLSRLTDFFLDCGSAELTRWAEAWGWGAHSHQRPVVCGSACACQAGGDVSPESPTSPSARGRGSGQQSCSLLAGGLCKSKSIRGEEGIGLAPGCQLERDELLLRKEAALQLCVHVGREEGLSWQ